MTPVVPQPPQGAQTSGAFKVDISRGARIGRVSSEWFSRPEDERYLSLSSLYEAVRDRADRASSRIVETRAIRVEADRDSPERLQLVVPGRPDPVAPTHWSFGQLCSLVGAPAGYLRALPAPLAGINMQHGLVAHRGEQIKTLEADDGRLELRAATGPDYGRIWDYELVEAVMKIAGDGVGDTRWKVPGLLDWSAMTHNPFVDITKDTTTLYASDRDVFLFLVGLQEFDQRTGDDIRLLDTMTVMTAFGETFDRLHREAQSRSELAERLKGGPDTPPDEGEPDPPDDA